MTNNNDLVVSAIGLRKLIGWLGALLPLLCFLCSGLAQAAIGTSISAYYFTGIHGFFTGILCGLGVCLFTYRGFSKLESNLATFGGLCAFGVAICPTSGPQHWKAAPDEWVPAVVHLFAGPSSDTLAIFHGAFAGLLFVVFMVFAGALFTRSHASDQDDPLTVKGILMALFQTVILLRANPKDPKVLPDSKERRNKLYRICARLIALSVLMVMGEALAEEFHLVSVAPFPQWVFVWEVVAIWAFAFSWLTKAESFAFIKDQPQPGPQIGATEG